MVKQTNIQHDSNTSLKSSETNRQMSYKDKQKDKNQAQPYILLLLNEIIIMCDEIFIQESQIIKKRYFVSMTFLESLCPQFVSVLLQVYFSAADTELPQTVPIIKTVFLCFLSESYGLLARWQEISFDGKLHVSVSQKCLHQRITVQTGQLEDLENKNVQARFFSDWASDSNFGLKIIVHVQDHFSQLQEQIQTN